MNKKNQKIKLNKNKTKIKYKFQNIKSQDIAYCIQDCAKCEYRSLRDLD